MNINYPIKFTPILKEKIWGGNKLKDNYNKKSNSSQLGESWEISGVEGDISIVSNGVLKGQSLTSILNEYKGKLVGENNYKKFGCEFPLLIKFIDANEALSIQVHPNDELARKRHGSFGKTEMWYVMEAEPSSNLIVGFNRNVSKEEYEDYLKNNSLLEILNTEQVKKRDTFFIPAGRIHAIGAGVVLAEIQQTSDITYRVYDWDRVDDAGVSRELHTAQALDVIEYTTQNKYSADYRTEENKSLTLVSCDYFTTNILDVSGEIEINNSDKDSFVIYMCVEGEVSIRCNEKNEENLSCGETVFIPSSFKKYKIASTKNAKLLEVYIKS